MERNTSSKGDAFERYIAQIYENLGFSVEQNVSINGQQVDLLAKKTVKGVGETSLIIECKYLEKGSLSNQKVFDFVNFTVALERSGYSFFRGVLVTNATVTNSAKLAASNSSVEILTQRALELELFDFRKAYQAFTKQYKREAIFRQYVPLDGIDKETRGSLRNVEMVISRLLETGLSPLSFSVVLADYGSGKTTLLERLRFSYSERYLSESGSLKPLFFELKHYSKYGDLDSYIAATLKKQLGFDMPMELFWREVHNGGFLLLLDGFDEMSAKVDSALRLRNFNILLNLLATSCPAVLTCRPSYFVTQQEYERLINLAAGKKLEARIGKSGSRRYVEKRRAAERLYEGLRRKYINKGRLPTLEQDKKATTIHLSSFSEEQIDTYLMAFNKVFEETCSITSQEVKAFLLRIYDLRDLMTKPILLSMIKDSLLLIGKEFFDEEHEYGPASLYETYTNLIFDIDYRKGKTRQLLTPEQRREFAEAIALSMFDNDSLEVSFGKIVEVILNQRRSLARIGQTIKSAKAEEIASDLQICTFITRTEDDKFKFIHKSYMEFFVARFLKDSMHHEDIDRRYRQKKLPKEILIFVASFCMVDEQAMRSVQHYFSHPRAERGNNVLTRNISCIYIYTSQAHKAIDFAGRIIDNVDLKNVAFAGCNFHDLKARNTSWEEIRIENCSLNPLSFSESDVCDAQLIGTKGDLVLDKGSLTNANFSDSTLAVSARDSLIGESQIENTGIRLDGSLRFDSVNFIESQIAHVPKASSRIKFEECLFREVEFVARYSSNYLVSKDGKPAFRELGVSLNKVKMVDTLAVGLFSQAGGILESDNAFCNSYCIFFTVEKLSGKLPRSLREVKGLELLSDHSFAFNNFLVFAEAQPFFGEADRSAYLRPIMRFFREKMDKHHFHRLDGLVKEWLIE